MFFRLPCFPQRTFVNITIKLSFILIFQVFDNFQNKLQQIYFYVGKGQGHGKEIAHRIMVSVWPIEFFNSKYDLIRH